MDNNPTSSASFTIFEPHLITYIDTYHYNSGQGVSDGGTISLKRDDGEIFGPWTVTAESGSGAANAWWKCLPFVVIPAGTYTIIDSEPETWSMNTESNGGGFSKVEGHPEYSVSVSEPDRVENVAQEEAADVSLDSGKETEAAMKAGTFQLPKCPMIKTPDEPNPYGAPLMQNPEIASGAKCRGACGEDCPSDRCKSVPDVEIPVEDLGDTQAVCVYSSVIECPTHQGCRDHDACYDKCAEEGHTVVFELSQGGPDECHSACNQRCYDKWTNCQCYAWADVLPSLAQRPLEYGCDNKFDGNLKFFWGEPQIKLVQKSAETVLEEVSFSVFRMNRLEGTDPTTGRPWKAERQYCQQFSVAVYDSTETYVDGGDSIYRNGDFTTSLFPGEYKYTIQYKYTMPADSGSKSGEFQVVKEGGNMFEVETP